MYRFNILLLSLAFVSARSANSQSYEGLAKLNNESPRIFYSKGNDERAISISGRLSKAMKYYKDLLQFEPEVTLLILSPADWTKHTSFPVYGMPHYKDDKTLVVAAEDNDLWKSFLPPLDQLPPNVSEQVLAVYRRSDGSVSMERFFDLLALHELGHAFHQQAGITMQRNWMSELFVNIFLHTYIAKNEPESIQALSLFPNMVVANGTKDLKYTSLNDLETNYRQIAQQYPKNYGWYQCRWHVAAADIYDASNPAICKTLWTALKSNPGKLGDKELLVMLDDSGLKSIADMARNWDKNTVR